MQKRSKAKGHRCFWLVGRTDFNLLLATSGRGWQNRLSWKNRSRIRPSKNTDSDPTLENRRIWILVFRQKLDPDLAKTLESGSAPRTSGPKLKLHSQLHLVLVCCIFILNSYKPYFLDHMAKPRNYTFCMNCKPKKSTYFVVYFNPDSNPDILLGYGFKILLPIFRYRTA